MERVKTIRQKGQSDYSSPIPIGTDGNLVDMFSELNLEYELKLGTKHIASIESIPSGDITITKITENYATPDEVITPNMSFYRVYTTITPVRVTPGETTRITDIITAELYWIENDDTLEDIQENFIKGKETQIIEEDETIDEQTVTKFIVEEVYFDTPTNQGG